MSLSGRYQPQATQAEITRKFQFDFVEARERQANAENGNIANEVYPGGNNKDNLKVYPGDLVMGRRKPRHYNAYHGNPKETGFTGLAGLHWGEYASDEAMMRDFYPIGFAKTEIEFGGDNWAYQDPLDHGGSAVGAGSYTGHNWSGEQIHAGDLLVWAFPSTNRNTGAGIDPINRQYREGTPLTKPMAYLMPARSLTSKPLLDALITTMGRRRDQHPQPGVQDLTRDDLEQNESLTSLQEEALALREGVKSLLNLDDNDSVAEAIVNNREAVEMMLDAMHSALMSRFSRIVGVAMTSAKPSQDVTVMLSHYKVN